MKYHLPITRTLALAALLVSSASCSSGIELAVDLQTDLVSGVEFDSVQVVLDGVVSTPLAVDGAHDYGAGRRVHEAGSMSPGPHDLWVTLLQGPVIVVSRRYTLDLDASLIFTAVLTRDCRGVTCPGADDAATETECFGGRCVAPSCGTLGEASCLGTECRFDSDCASDTACVAAVCSRGVCLQSAGACGPGEYCHPELDCQPLHEGGDAGMPGDAGPPDAGPCATTADCDDAIECTRDACTGGRCTHETDDTLCVAGFSPRCDPAAPGADPVSGCVSEACDATTCVAGPCQDASCVDGVCERTERCSPDQICCDGVCAASCDEVPCAGQPAGTVCRPSAGPCDVAETCGGSDATCPPDGFNEAEFVCRPAAGPCDIAETCTGMSPACPTDRFAVLRLACRPAAGPCDVAEFCDGRSAGCPPDARQPPSTVCRPAVSVCDVEETCGFTLSTACPSDRFAAAGIVCRPGRTCDPQEVCTGASATCPPNAVSPNGSACDLGCGRETCSGGFCTGGVSCAPPNVCVCDVCSPPGSACD